MVIVQTLHLHWIWGHKSSSRDLTFKKIIPLKSERAIYTRILSQLFIFSQLMSAFSLSALTPYCKMSRHVIKKKKPYQAFGLNLPTRNHFITFCSPMSNDHFGEDCHNF